MKMNPEVKEKWLTALRSGLYRQGHHRLKRGFLNPSHCCLGVLCEVASLEGLVTPKQTGLSLHTFVSTEGGSIFGEFMPPGNVMKWANLDTKDAAHLVEMNDSGKPFSEIADYIETNL